jgi:type II secretory pathway pseudopilin PulG
MTKDQGRTKHQVGAGCRLLGGKIGRGLGRATRCGSGDPRSGSVGLCSEALARQVGVPGKQAKAVSPLRSATALHNGGFTMVEIALCIAIVGFALVAIVGVLPLGMQVQRDNREETIINHDGAFFIEAIRNGQGINDLSIFVEEITQWTNPPAGPASSKIFQIQVTNNPAVDGWRVVGLLSNPMSWRNEAIVRSLNGPAAEKGVMGDRQELAFRYKLFTEIRPFTSFDPDMMSTNLLSILQTNFLHEVRLTFRYPLLPQGKTGTGKKVFRVLVSGTIEQQKDPDDELWFFRPQRFTAIP